MQPTHELPWVSRKQTRPLSVAKNIPTSENLIGNTYEILFVTCLASDSEMTKQGRVTFPVIIKIYSFPFILAQNVLKKTWISIITINLKNIKFPYSISHSTLPVPCFSF